MNQDFSTALLLMAVGMITVFSILALIVLLGTWLIKIINRFFPDSGLSNTPVTSNKTDAIHPAKLAAIVTAVDIATKGKGKVISAERSRK